MVYFLEPVQISLESRNILDIGSGTGLISIMLAQRCDAEITAIEPDNESYLQACENVSRCPWHNRIKVKQPVFKTLIRIGNSI